ncbi:long-chain-acyl-CoA dehydrogenase [Mycobacterium saskatchewanense]|uniref:Acyl-CoA dehydrogenase n=1 Tax=Mycobacterium saskatchewanense TaxID=220927 RepID=A0AAJ3TTH9_9MYCO|nr:acyl-CoA dehydrogenase family protein [Mycobacterium saskatchewanense]ORW68098.1 acyl-CoA dehydrogenase [Mycobacterium saskatchewanense]BBX66454.1 long-chain-acyl-CoA dehydrogenase [Mycobacterium saskatchewanense]
MRTIFDPEHDAFRQLARTFFEKECAPHTARWEEQGHVDRDVWLRAGDVGLLGWEAPEEYGGAGIKDFRYNAVMTEEFIATGSVGFGYALHNDVMPPYLIDLTTQEQKKRWLPGWVSGELITAIAMTEPGAGSDLKSITTTAKPTDGGFRLNGAKTYITNGLLADLVLVVAKTEPTAGHRGISLLMVERGMEGFHRGRKLDKVGMRAQDTAELFFEDVFVPATNLVGEQGRGFYHLMKGLSQERVGCAVTSTAVMERALHLTCEFVRSRKVFGQPLGAMQNTQFKLAEVAASFEVCRTFTDSVVAELVAGTLAPHRAAVAKMFVTERQWEAIDECVQLFGGAGYMNEYEIARLWRDTRIQRVLAGSNEVMRHIIGRSLELESA